MNDLPKSWYTSKTVWGGIVAGIMPIAAVLSAQFHFVLPASDTIVNDLTAAGTLAGAAIAVWGRISASAPIAKPSTPKQ